QQVLMQGGGKNTRLPIQGPFKMRVEPALAKIWKQREQILSLHIVEPPGTVNFHPTIPGLDAEGFVQCDNTIGSKLLNPREEDSHPGIRQFPASARSPRPLSHFSLFPFLQFQKQRFQRSHAQDDDQVTTHIAGPEVKTYE